MNSAPVHDAEVRTCVECGCTKPLDQFQLKNPRTGTRRRNCNACLVAYSRQFKRENPWSDGATKKASKRREVAAAAQRVRREFLHRAAAGCSTCGADLPASGLRLVQIAPLNVGAAKTLSNGLVRIKTDELCAKVFDSALAIECPGCLEERRKTRPPTFLLPSHLTLAELDEKAELPEWAKIKQRAAYGQRRIEAIHLNRRVSM